MDFEFKCIKFAGWQLFQIEKELTIFIRTSLINDLIYNPHRRFFLLRTVNNITPVASDINRFAIPGMRNVFTPLICHGSLGFFSLPPKVVLDIETSPFFQENADIVRCIIARIKTKQKLSIRYLTAESDRLRKKFRRSALAVLFPFAKFIVHQISFSTDVCKHGSIAITAFICSGDFLLVSLGIIKRRYIHVNRDIIVFHGFRADAVVSEHGYIFRQDLLAQGASYVVQSLAECFLEGGICHAECIFIKIRSVLHFTDSLKMRLSHTQHPNIG